MTFSRRDFLQTTAAGGALVTIGVGAPGCGNDVVAAPIADAMVNDTRNTPGYGQVVIQVDRYPQLAAVGGAITLKLQSGLDPNDQNRSYALPPDNTILLIQTAAGAFTAMQSSCPHAGCPLGYSAKDSQVECPCHSSRFRVTTDANDKSLCAGAVTHGPAASGLRTWQTTPNADGTLTIDLTMPLACNNTFPPVVAGTLTLLLADFPQLAMPGGSAAGQPPGLSNPVVVVRVDATTVAALDATCTHRGCPVGYDSGPKDLLCPCHGSVFGLDGSVKVGPASTPLTVYTSTVNDTAIVITIPAV